MSVHTSSDGGRSRARRLFVMVAIGLAGLLTVRPDASAVAPEAAPQVGVRESDGVYCVTAQFVVTQPPSVVLSVLTDYEQIPHFMPDMKSSIVRERSADRVLVEQEAVARVMMFSKRIHLLLEVRAQDSSLHFRDASGRSFTKYEGSWRVEQVGGRTTVRYDLSATPSFDVPSFLLTRLLRRDANQMIERLRTEIAARAR
jgi:ribosome-associated toxin RatA of RatAB toxin-antitoxin module